MRLGLASAITLVLLPATIAEAREVATLTRIDAANVELARDTEAPVAIWLSDDELIDAGDQLVSARSVARKTALPLAADKRRYVILLSEDGAANVIAERVLPLQQASNFRDIGGYVTKDGRTVRWGKAFRSGAMPLLTEADYGLIGQLDLDSVVDFRSLDEREVTADQVDDRTGALFIANDYGMKTLMGGISADKENMYRGMEKLLAPQYRAVFKRLIADEGAVLYHCSAGQDRTGVATALIYDVLGVDRETILKDYHRSTDLRQLQWEMPKIDPKDYPGNFLVQYYAASAAKGRTKAEPLYTPAGASHLAQFFVHLDQQYGGSEGYLKQVLGLQDAEIAKLREMMLR
jgi:protein-tyrosine phosphatase